MLKSIKFDKELRKDFKIKNFKYLFLKTFFEKDFRYKKVLKLYGNLNLKKTKVNNFCFLTGRSKSVYKKFKLSRHQIKLLAVNNFITGLQKSSW